MGERWSLRPTIAEGGEEGVCREEPDWEGVSHHPDTAALCGFGGKRTNGSSASAGPHRFGPVTNGFPVAMVLLIRRAINLWASSV